MSTSIIERVSETLTVFLIYDFTSFILAIHASCLLTLDKPIMYVTKAELCLLEIINWNNN